MSSLFEGIQIPELVIHRILSALGPFESSKFAQLNKSWKNLVLSQLYRRLLSICIPEFESSCFESSPGFGPLSPPIADETWFSLFNKLVLTRRNTTWRPIKEVSVDTLGSNEASVSDSSPTEISTSGPMANTQMHMPLPDNYDSQVKPVSLPSGFEWVDLDLENEKDFSKIANFLDLHALEDQEESFKLGWTIPQLKRLLGYRYNVYLKDSDIKQVSKPVVVSVQTISNQNLVGFVCAIPVHLRLWNEVAPFFLIRQLCVHKKMRGHRVARVVVKELSRRIHQQIIPEKRQAFFTLGVQMPFRLLTSYGAYHRTLNYENFVNAGLKPSIDPKQVPLDNVKILPNLRVLKPEDLVVVFPFVESFYERFKISIAQNGAEFALRYLPREGATYSYVLFEDQEQKQPIGFFSISQLNYNMLNPDVKTKSLRIGYCDVIFPAQNQQLVKSMLAIAQREGFDEVELGANMEHSKIVSDPTLHFKVGTGIAYHYMHNWICDDIGPEDWGFSEDH